MGNTFEKLSSFSNENSLFNNEFIPNYKTPIDKMIKKKVENTTDQAIEEKGVTEND